MIGWVILGVFGGLTLIIAILLALSVKADIEYNGDFTVKVKYLFITVYPREDKDKGKKKKKTKKLKKPKKNKHSARGSNKKAEGTSAQPAAKSKSKSKQKASDGGSVTESGKAMVNELKKANKNSLDFDMIMLMVDSAKPPFKRLIRNLRVSGFRLDFVLGGDDAAKVALNYGLQSALVSGFIAWLKETVVLQVDRVNITADFMSEETKQYVKCRVKIRLSAAVLALLHYLVKFAKGKKKQAL